MRYFCFISLTALCLSCQTFEKDDAEIKKIADDAIEEVIDDLEKEFNNGQTAPKG